MSDLIERLVGLFDKMQRMDDVTERDITTVLNAKHKIERLQARVEARDGALMEIRQAAEDNNLMPDYIIALTMAVEQENL